jgi:hypothetical protein
MRHLVGILRQNTCLWQDPSTSTEHTFVRSSPFIIYLTTLSSASLRRMVGMVNDQFGKDMARRRLCLNDVAPPALAEGTEKTHKPQDTQPRSRNSNSVTSLMHTRSRRHSSHIHRYVSQVNRTTDFSTFARCKIVSAWDNHATFC